MRYLGILGSTRGTDMQAIIDAIQQERLSARINVVISNKEDAYILKRAEQHELNTEFVDSNGVSREDYDRELSDILHKYDVELVVLIGYMRILSNEFIAEWQNKIINVHPSLLPAFAGGMDGNVHLAVLDSGIQETGCTVHYVTEKVDAGPIILQKTCPVLANDTMETLKARVQELEGQALVEVIASL
jgi:phosphoribosylglycinamide formyltransferase-1